MRRRGLPPSGEPPIKSALMFKWSWDQVTSMDELEERMKKNMFYTLRPVDDLIVATSLTNPSMIIFAVIQRDRDGGDLIVIQNPGGWYSDEDIAEHIPLFDKVVGIKTWLAHSLKPSAPD